MSKKPRMNANRRKSTNADKDAAPIGVHSRPFADSPELFDRIVTILEQARGNVVRAVNTNMVAAYWMIGREIVEEVQRGKDRAEYGEKVMESLSKRLTERYGKGFSVPNLQNFRKFYLAYSTRVTMGADIQYPTGTKSMDDPIQHPMGTKSAKAEIPHPAGAELTQSFSPLLSWSHYRVLMRVDSADARAFYEREAIEGGWDKRTLERQVHTQYYDRCLHSQQPDRMIADGRRLQHTPATASELLKNPYVLEFLGYPDFAELRESDVEQAIITHLQRFLLELGNGFAFVARQKHIRIEEEDRYIDRKTVHAREPFHHQ